MSNFFDDIENEFQKYIKNIKNSFDGGHKSNFDFDSQAWQELEDFLNDKKTDDFFKSQNDNFKSSNSSAQSSQDDEIKKDYANLQLQYTQDIDIVKKKYKKMILEFHPDKFIDDPAMYEKSNIVIKKLSKSYMNIVEYLGKKN